MFYGILVSMFVLDTDKHHLPHIHARYNEFKAVIGIPEGELLDGQLARAADETDPGMGGIAS